MRHVSRLRASSARLAILAGLVTSTTVTAACSNGSTGSGNSENSSNSNAESSKARLDAKAVTKRYTDSPSAFPVTTPLPKALPTGTKFGYLQCISVPCAQLATIYHRAVAAAGGTLTVVKAGASAQEFQTAMTSLIERHPAAIILPSEEPSVYATQIRQATKAGIKVVAVGVMDGKKYGAQAVAFGKTTATLAGKLQADWVAANMPDDTKIVFYGTSELSFSGPTKSGFKSELARVCPGCSFRTQNIPIASYGSGAASLVVSDLQSHPDTKLGVFVAASAAIGLPSALNVAGIKTPYIGFSLTPSNLQDIKGGRMRAGLGLDNQVLAWTAVDAASRLILGAPLPAAEAQEAAVLQWLTPHNLTGDLSTAWTGYPDVEARFTKLWQGK